MKKVVEVVKIYGIILFGSALFAVSLDLFLVPNKIAPGGASGISTIIHVLTGLPVGILFFTINLPLLIWGYKSLGKSFAVRTIFAVVISAVMTDLLASLPPVTDERVLSSVFGGALMGAALGIVFWAGGSTGGTDIVAKLILKKFPGVRLGTIIVVIDFFIIAASGLLLGDYELALYAFIAIFVSTKMVDNIVEGTGFTKAAFIISKNSDKIAEKIIKEIYRGVTGFYGKGIYEGQEGVVLLCVLTRGEVAHLKRIVKEYDENAFLILTDAREVVGQGFKSISGS